jgi:hypothetical protein
MQASLCMFGSHPALHNALEQLTLLVHTSPSKSSDESQSMHLVSSVREHALAICPSLQLPTPHVVQEGVSPSQYALAERQGGGERAIGESRDAARDEEAPRPPNIKIPPHACRVKSSQVKFCFCVVD